MAEDGRYLTENNGAIVEERAVQTSAGAADVDKLARLNSDGQWDESLLPNAEVQVKTAYETLSGGNFIHMRSDGQVEKADATSNAKPASGFVKAGITATQTGKVYGEGVVGGFVGLTVGAPVFLSTTAGGVTQDVSSYTTGNYVQKLGVAWSATEIKVEIAQGITKA